MTAASWILLPHLEYSLTAACNLRCEQCSFRVPHQPAPERPVRPERFRRDLETLADRRVRVRRFRLLGGEALLSPFVEEIAAIARRSHVVGSLEIITNGLLVARAPRSLWTYFDEIAISIYPVTEPIADQLVRYFELLGHAEKLRLVRRTWDRQDPLPDPVGVDKALAAFGACTDRHFCATYEGGRLYRCSRAAKWGTRRDGLELAAASPSEIHEYLQPATCPAICRTCRPKLAYEVVPRGAQRADHAARAEQYVHSARRDLRRRIEEAT